MPHFCKLPEFFSAGAVHIWIMVQKSVIVGSGIESEYVLKL